MTMRRIALDTNVVISAVLQARGQPALCVRLALSSDFTWIVSEELLAEYDEVLKRPRFGFDARSVDTFLEVVRSEAHLVDPTPLPRGVASDPDDVMVLGTAVAGKALFLVTGNMKHFPASHRGTEVLTPAQFLGKAAEKRRRTATKALIKRSRGKRN